MVLWELWRSRCASKFGSELPSIQRSTALISYNISQLFKQKFRRLEKSLNWERLQDILDMPINHRSYKLVKWVKSPPQYWKLDSDGSCVEGSCGAGGIIRDSEGKLILAYSVYLGRGTSNWAEGQAMLICLQKRISME